MQKGGGRSFEPVHYAALQRRNVISIHCCYMRATCWISVKYNWIIAQLIYRACNYLPLHCYQCNYCYPITGKLHVCSSRILTNLRRLIMDSREQRVIIEIASSPSVSCCVMNFLYVSLSFLKYMSEVKLNKWTCNNRCHRALYIAQ